MIRLTKFLFLVTDILAILILGGTSLQAALYPIVGPIYARMNGQVLSTASTIEASFLCAAAAIGAYLVLRRRASGIALIATPLLLSSRGDTWIIHLGLAMVMALALGMPFLLALQQTRLKVTSSQFDNSGMEH